MVRALLLSGLWIAQPAAGAPDPARLAQARNISSLIQPCASRERPPSLPARAISPMLRVNVGRDGVPTSHEVIRVAGVTDANRTQVDAVVAISLRAVRACATRIASLPPADYDIRGGWKSFLYRFRFQ